MTATFERSPGSILPGPLRTNQLLLSRARGIQEAVSVANVITNRDDERAHIEIHQLAIPVGFEPAYLHGSQLFGKLFFVPHQLSKPSLVNQAW
jgi:hypothetical protein